MPFSLEAEQSVLGSVLIDPSVLDVLTGIITAEDFYLEEHRQIYSAMQGMFLRSKNIDVVTLVDELVREGVYDESGGKDYL
ncbi:MAG: replicative DNA helicase, partial [Clostridia bacterium]|nr:replicative DNA helicase [Clostridia bacterium]